MKKLSYPLTKNPFLNDDLKEGIKVIKSKQLTLSKKTKEIENYFGKKLNIKYSTMVNSGSSANLLAFQTLINPYRKNPSKNLNNILASSVSMDFKLVL